MIDVLYIAGAIASILGAIYAWRHATNAKGYAEKASRQFAGHRRSSDLSHLKTLWESMYEVLAVFGPCACVSDLRGRTVADAARKAQDYVTEVINRRTCLQAVVNLDNRREMITQRISDFSAARSADDMKTRGTALLVEMENLNAAVCSALNAELEAVDLS